ncbi:hypothetical protein A8L34_13765 [Bacillus sp. FJAT-27264]|uniref:hypothetical protein n=1 Tax=Paenibacillus sp. (strain DSM 101736 / FJAT-27264) TaxID=1850362 RepID=UPI000807CD38|nr:hypothetical protein [Bacillus sp. FJAT-27264]OBZ14943.1 hypothetical protein A8L34_13765 [Bacillus sp. FJAT-27264]
MNKKWFSKLIAIVPMFALITSIVIPVDTASAGPPWRSSLYPENWTPGYTDAQGRFLQDFSYAGYWRGEKTIPTSLLEPPIMP